MAAPEKFDAEAKEIYLELVEEVPVVKTCAEAVGVTRQTVYNHRESDPEFALAERKALGRGRVNLARQVRSPEWLLSKSDPETYTDLQRLEHAGGVNITISGQWMPDDADDGD